MTGVQTCALPIYQFHGSLYEFNRVSALSSNTYQNNANDIAKPGFTRNQFGYSIGGPIIKNKLFFFTSYQGIRVSDSLLATSQASVPLHLTNDRSAAAIANVANTDFEAGITASQIDPVALALLQQKNKDGSYFVPTPQITDPQEAQRLGYDALVPGPPSRFTADQANFNLDFTASEKDHIEIGRASCRERV